MKTLIQLTLLALFGSSLIAAEIAGAKPNIIYLLSDDIGYGDIGFNGCKDIQTPKSGSARKTGGGPGVLVWPAGLLADACRAAYWTVTPTQMRTLAEIGTLETKTEPAILKFTDLNFSGNS